MASTGVQRGQDDEHGRGGTPTGHRTVAGGRPVPGSGPGASWCEAPALAVVVRVVGARGIEPLASAV
jgi:hypothetical protein